MEIPAGKSRRRYFDETIDGRGTCHRPGNPPGRAALGPYQFPIPFRLDDRIVVAVHVTDDNISSYGATNRWFESRDEGITWNEIDPSVSAQCGLKLPNGDRIYFPMESGIRLEGYRFTPGELLTPDYDFGKRAPEGTLPIPDGMTYWFDGTVIRAYNADRLPESLAKKSGWPNGFPPAPANRSKNT